MAAQYPATGFQYIEGPANIRWSIVTSTATFLRGALVAYHDVTRQIVELDAGSDTTAIYGVAMANATSGSSLGGAFANRCPVLIPTEETVFAAAVQTGVVAGGLEVGEALNVEKAGNYHRVDTDSKASARVVLVERGLSGVAYDSADSTVYCQFLKNVIYPFGSNASLRVGTA